MKRPVVDALLIALREQQQSSEGTDLGRVDDILAEAGYSHDEIAFGLKSLVRRKLVKVAGSKRVSLL
jgi:hypothetical protein